jgi:aryl-alcohol dehydrogenase-like predicted oxidoreductase
MNALSSRRTFLSAGLGVPVVASLSGRMPESRKLDFRELGKTGLKVSALGFGCMTTSDPAVIERAADLGINYFDTARSYQGGNNERMVGAALKGKRKQVIVSSKTQGKTKQEALADLDTSLRELETDYLDIWYLHSKSRPEEVADDLLEAQETARKEGKIRFAGVSTHFNMPDMLANLVRRGRTDVTLAGYNFTMKTEVTKAIEAARKAGMGVVAMKVLAGGFSRIRRGDRLYGINPDSLTKTLKQEGAMLAAIKWALKNRSIDTAIVCMTDFDQLDENLRAMSEPFTDRDASLLAAQLASIRTIYCRMCGGCSGVCEQGVPVVDLLRFLSYAEGYGQFAMARERFLELPEPVRQIRCRECSSCSVYCPNGVEVRNRLMRAQDIFA